jgi:hypothetical protein
MSHTTHKQKKKPLAMDIAKGFGKEMRSVILTLRELEALTCAGQTVLLTFSLSGVTCQEALLFECVVQAIIFADKSARNTEACCDRLSFDTAAFDADDHVETAIAA